MALSDEDHRLLAFADRFERDYIGQGAGDRTITESLDLAWSLLDAFPAEALKRLDPDVIARHRGEG
jgi:vacuolar-type H+-ATPase subunit B/Vma2